MAARIERRLCSHDYHSLEGQSRLFDLQWPTCGAGRIRTGVQHGLHATKWNF